MEDNKEDIKKDEEKSASVNCDESLVFRDEQTRLKMERHMSDMNDVITEDDIRNIKTDVTPNSVNKPCEDKVESLPETEEEEKPANQGEGTDIGSPWAVLK
jgi:argonaute-like protein implicated in RNA metabolism and viral defense